MPLLINFYAIIGILFVIVVVTQTEYALSSKLMLCLIFWLILLWIEKPDWFTQISGQIGILV